jgi:multisubunit Na+/H+ antiporter MnhG subunit
VDGVVLVVCVVLVDFFAALVVELELAALFVLLLVLVLLGLLVLPPQPVTSAALATAARNSELIPRFMA